ncbi:MAG: DUF3267 domain-containing protein [Clostridia bacterium]|nr:DUF3267 domain-containing protein [Clostridia bacterium]
MDRTKNFTRELPEGYRLVKTVDAGNKRFGFFMNLAAAALSAFAGVGGFFLKFGSDPGSSVSIGGNVWVFEGMLLGLLAALIAYLVLHELTHGIVYKILTGEKLTFGLKLTCAYCGVPDIYVTRRTALLSLLAPFTLFSVVFLVPFILLQGPLSLGFLILFALHFGGCVGDLYDTFLLLFRLKGKLLMRDSGPQQNFYVYSPTGDPVEGE